MRASPAGDWTIDDVVALCREVDVSMYAAKRRRFSLESIRSIAA
jgi:hypothetical protein